MEAKYNVGKLKPPDTIGLTLPHKMFPDFVCMFKYTMW